MYHYSLNFRGRIMLLYLNHTHKQCNAFSCFPPLSYVHISASFHTKILTLPVSVFLTFIDLLYCTLLCCHMIEVVSYVALQCRSYETHTLFES